MGPIFLIKNCNSLEEMTETQKHPLQQVLESRIAIIDGATGTTIRDYGMKEAGHSRRAVC